MTERESTTWTEPSGILSGAKPSLKSHLLSGGGWAFGGQVLLTLSGLLVNAFLVRLLSPEEMGTYFLTLSLVSFTALVAQLGLNRVVVKLIAESIGMGRPARARAAVRSIFQIAAVGMLLSAAVLYLGAGQWIARHLFSSPLMGTVIGLAALWALVLATQDLLAETFRGFHDIPLATLFKKLLSTVISAVFFGSLWIFQGHSNLPQIIILSIVAGITSVSIAGLILRIRLRATGDGKEDLQRRLIWTMAWPLLITSVTLFARSQADIWVLGAFRPQEDIAIYGAAFRLAALVGMPLLIANAVIPPLIAEMYAQGKTRELEQTLRTTATLTSLPSLLAVIFLAFFGASILGFVYGDFYREGATVLSLISIGQLFSVWAGSGGYALMMTGNEMTLMWITIASGLLTISGAIWVAGPYGGPGVAGVAASTLILQNILTIYWAKKKSGIWTFGWLSPKDFRRTLS